jgi:hypothetical protein
MAQAGSADLPDGESKIFFGRGLDRKSARQANQLPHRAGIAGLLPNARACGPLMFADPIDTKKREWDGPMTGKYCRAITIGGTIALLMGLAEARRSK